MTPLRSWHLSVLQSLICLIFAGLVLPVSAADLPLQAKECPWVVLSRISSIASNSRSKDGTVAVGTMEVLRYLKGDSAGASIEVEFHFQSHLEMSPSPQETIWFLRKKLENGRYLVTDWQWSAQDTYRVLDAIWRADKLHGIPEMPEPANRTQPITVSLAIGDGEGRISLHKKASFAEELVFIAQFKNHESPTVSVMPCLDGSDVQWRYPHYVMEIRNAANEPVVPRGVGRCGNVNSFSASDFVSLRQNEIFRTVAPPPMAKLEPGKYRIRLHYTAKRDLSARGAFGPNEKEVPSLMKAVWEGAIESNWVDVEIERPAIESK